MQSSSTNGRPSSGGPPPPPPMLPPNLFDTNTTKGGGDAREALFSDLSKGKSSIHIRLYICVFRSRYNERTKKGDSRHANAQESIVESRWRNRCRIVDGRRSIADECYRPRNQRSTGAYSARKWQTMECGEYSKCQTSFVYINALRNIINQTKALHSKWPIWNKQSTFINVWIRWFKSKAKWTRLRSTHARKRRSYLIVYSVKSKLSTRKVYRFR